MGDSERVQVGLYKDGQLVRTTTVTVVPHGWQPDEPLDLEPGELLMAFLPGERTLRSFPPTSVPGAGG